MIYKSSSFKFGLTRSQSGIHGERSITRAEHLCIRWGLDKSFLAILVRRGLKLLTRLLIRVTFPIAHEDSN